MLSADTAGCPVSRHWSRQFVVSDTARPCQCCCVSQLLPTLLDRLLVEILIAVSDTARQSYCCNVSYLFPTLLDSVIVVMFHTCFQHCQKMLLCFSQRSTKTTAGIKAALCITQPKVRQSMADSIAIQPRQGQTMFRQSMADSIAVQPRPGRPMVRQSMGDSVAIQLRPGRPITLGDLSSICPSWSAQSVMDSIDGGDCMGLLEMTTLPCGCQGGLVRTFHSHQSTALV